MISVVAQLSFSPSRHGMHDAKAGNGSRDKIRLDAVTWVAAARGSCRIWG